MEERERKLGAEIGIAMFEIELRRGNITVEEEIELIRNMIMKCKSEGLLDEIENTN